MLSPSMALILIFVYAFILYTFYLSMTDSRMLPSYGFVGFENYEKLWNLRHWWRALTNLAIFGSLYIIICSVLGLFLAILLDQKIRGEGFLRPIYLYPMALSFIVTGTAWKWFLDPGIGLENTMHQWGWASFEFAWIKDRTLAIYTVVIAAVWQSSGFVMAMFLAGLRGVDSEIIKAAQMDGASSVTIYRRIIIPMMRPVFLSAFVVLAHLAIKSYDLVIALTGGGPGQATELPATFMYSYTFTRNQMGIGASSAIIMLVMIFSIIIPISIPN
ncbi:binding-protein-dependent transport system inner membrane protein [Nitratireductor aquibiodomus RA22]|uniref:Binding-protein-dependent transport system inner membrane protein n=1 Tax=Nitratireductor aquibiodomus RA22 TaxID=1189611 RepID=I5C6P2_9HYPH|nr:binding-protein-dependent transport system inner membrane protein [Nitratireductor aquibiodomus RA22]